MITCHYLSNSSSQEAVVVYDACYDRFMTLSFYSLKKKVSVLHIIQYPIKLLIT